MPEPAWPSSTIPPIPTIRCPGTRRPRRHVRRGGLVELLQRRLPLGRRQDGASRRPAQVPVPDPRRRRRHRSRRARRAARPVVGVTTASALSERLRGFAVDRLDELLRGPFRDWVIPRVFGGHPVAADVAADLAFTISHLRRAGVAELGGAPIDGALRHGAPTGRRTRHPHFLLLPGRRGAGRPRPIRRQPPPGRMDRGRAPEPRRCLRLDQLDRAARRRPPPPELPRSAGPLRAGQAASRPARRRVDPRRSRDPNRRDARREPVRVPRRRHDPDRPLRHLHRRRLPVLRAARRPARARLGTRHAGRPRSGPPYDVTRRIGDRLGSEHRCAGHLPHPRAGCTRSRAGNDRRARRLVGARRRGRGRRCPAGSSRASSPRTSTGRPTTTAGPIAGCR